MKNKLRALRSAQGWSQSDLGARLGVSRQTVNAIEAERYDPSLPLAFKIARVRMAQTSRLRRLSRQGKRFFFEKKNQKTFSVYEGIRRLSPRISYGLR